MKENGNYNINNWWTFEENYRYLSKLVNSTTLIMNFPALDERSLLIRLSEIKNIFNFNSVILILNVSAFKNDFSTNNHWVSICFKRDKAENLFEVTHIDPMGNDLSESIKKIILNHFQIINITELLKDNPIQIREIIDNKLEGNVSDCGPMMCYATALNTLGMNIPEVFNAVDESHKLGQSIRKSVLGLEDTVDLLESIKSLYTSLIKQTRDEVKIRF